MLQNAYLLAKFRADTAENEQHFAGILPKIGNYPTGPPGRCAHPLRSGRRALHHRVEDLSCRRTGWTRGVVANWGKFNSFFICLLRRAGARSRSQSIGAPSPRATTPPPASVSSNGINRSRADARIEQENQVHLA